MPAASYGAYTEDGYQLDEPSPEAIGVLIAELNHVDNTFVTFHAAGDDPVWYALASFRGDDIYEIEYRDVRKNEHRYSRRGDASTVSDEIAQWIAVRDN
ncbi:hypothetical protein Pth03_55520 [Planotetraspora thailandica]|uniref:Uncharacterized protein n=1 Tax=Planotetraspora thailandica TaxID=487172 RepID=A0A8J3V4C8_9ACTN|nr:hypothetical protein [Planotetraspora thailandica]GII57163.1 hypothetical protein Pth03_55520 [Planotetraspora thailandica]